MLELSCKPSIHAVFAVSPASFVPCVPLSLVLFSCDESGIDMSFDGFGVRDISNVIDDQRYSCLLQGFCFDAVGFLPVFPVMACAVEFNSGNHANVVIIPLAYKEVYRHIAYLLHLYLCVGSFDIEHLRKADLCEDDQIRCCVDQLVIKLGFPFVQNPESVPISGHEAKPFVIALPLVFPPVFAALQADAACDFFADEHYQPASQHDTNDIGSHFDELACDLVCQDGEVGRSRLFSFCCGK